MWRFTLSLNFFFLSQNILFVCVFFVFRISSLFFYLDTKRFSISVNCDSFGNPRKINERVNRSMAHITDSRFFVFEKEPKWDGQKNIPKMFLNLRIERGKCAMEWMKDYFSVRIFVEQCENRNIIDINTSSMHTTNQCAAGQNDERWQLEPTRRPKKIANANKCGVLCGHINCSHFSLNLINYLAKIAFSFVEFFWFIVWISYVQCAESWLRWRSTPCSVMHRSCVEASAPALLTSFMFMDEVAHVFDAVHKFVDIGVEVLVGIYWNPMRFAWICVALIFQLHSKPHAFSTLPLALSLSFSLFVPLAMCIFVSCTEHSN